MADKDWQSRQGMDGPGQDQSPPGGDSGTGIPSEEEIEAPEGKTLLPEEQEGFVSWEQEKRELIEQLQRERANFDNYRRISRQEQEGTREYALFDFFKKLLPVLDDLERAMLSADQEETVSPHLQGLEMIYNRLCKLLSGEGVSRIEAENEIFDPNFHHAVVQVDGRGISGTIVEELAKGYIFKDRILRPSMVKVLK